ncbi:hypothetical protein Cgig2_008520 [Carnegiea gigantea]|uniref:Uncharacterized protein n=1 Tax=Carnegiea gigantea TaxID=171969 RepID=A0A9Q1JS65_9CARY|nr:hypothetical protein Cgig2_008520 [Carnegiea gigantea]
MTRSGSPFASESGQSQSVPRPHSSLSASVGRPRLGLTPLSRLVFASHSRVSSMASYNDDPVQDHVPEFMDIAESSGNNGDGNDVEVDLESHVKVKKVKKQASKMATNKEKGNQRRPLPPPTKVALHDLVDFYGSSQPKPKKVDHDASSSCSVGDKKAARSQGRRRRLTRRKPPANERRAPTRAVEEKGTDEKEEEEEEENYLEGEASSRLSKKARSTEERSSLEMFGF